VFIGSLKHRSYNSQHCVYRIIEAQII